MKRFGGLKNRLAWFLGIRPVLKKWFKTPEGRRTEKQMSEFLAGRKEILTRAIAALILLATTLGWTDFVAPLQALHDAFAAGNPVAVIGALFGFVMLVVGIFARMGADRKHAESLRTAQGTTNAVEDK